MKNRHIGSCKMCLLERPLASSHLMPAALYDYCRTEDNKPFRVGGGFVIPTDRQTQDYLLCDGCEDTLSRGGETWLLDKLATWERQFPLHDLLSQQPPEFDEDGSALYYTARNPAIDVAKLTHFAIGMFWKASVHPWLGNSAEPRIELGPYSDRIRLWLRGEGMFPEHVYLLAAISRPQRAQITLNDPYESERRGWRTFIFHVPGLMFMLLIGKTVDLSMRALCFFTNPGHPICVSDDLTHTFERQLAQSFQQSRKTQSYLGAMGRIEQERLRRT
jgi:hypothetical protein